MSSWLLVSYRSEKSITSARSGVLVKAAMPMSTCPDWTAGMMPSNAMSTTSSSTPRESAICCASHISQPVKLASRSLNSYGGYWASVPTTSLPDCWIFSSSVAGSALSAGASSSAAGVSSAGASAAGVSVCAGVSAAGASVCAGVLAQPASRPVVSTTASRSDTIILNVFFFMIFLLAMYNACICVPYTHNYTQAVQIVKMEKYTTIGAYRVNNCAI